VNSTTQGRVFKGDYFDGRSAKKFPVTLRLAPERLHLFVPGKPDQLWHYSEIRLTQVGGEQGPVRLERETLRYGKEIVEAVVVNDPEFLNQADEVAPGTLISFWKRPQNRKWRRILLVLALIAIPPFLYGVWTVGVPKLSDTVAEKVPTQWERKLGDTVFQSIPQLSSSSEPDPKVQAALDEIAQRLLQTVPEQPYEFRIHVHPGKVVNAMALPGGQIVVFQGLLNLTETPEELAGVLAHEFQHVLLRHSTRGIIRQLASSFLLAIVVGDSNQVMTQVMGAAGELDSLNFSRNMEREADRAGMQMLLKANVKPSGMIRIFEKFKDQDDSPRESEKNDEKQKDLSTSESDDESNDWMEYFSTHPANEDRISTLRELSRHSETAPNPLLPNFDWTQMHSKSKKEIPEP